MGMAMTTTTTIASMVAVGVIAMIRCIVYRIGDGFRDDGSHGNCDGHGGRDGGSDSKVMVVIMIYRDFANPSM